MLCGSLGRGVLSRCCEVFIPAKLFDPSPMRLLPDGVCPFWKEETRLLRETQKEIGYGCFYQDASVENDRKISPQGLFLRAVSLQRDVPVIDTRLDHVIGHRVQRRLSASAPLLLILHEVFEENAPMGACVVEWDRSAFEKPYDVLTRDTKKIRRRLSRERFVLVHQEHGFFAFHGFNHGNKEIVQGLGELDHVSTVGDELRSDLAQNQALQARLLLWRKVRRSKSVFDVCGHICIIGSNRYKRNQHPCEFPLILL